MKSFIQHLSEEHTGYHVTPTKNLDNILAKGLRPARGPRSKAIGETDSAIHLFKTSEAAHDGMNWLGDHLPEDEPLSLLKVSIPKDATRVGKAADYEHRIGSATHPKHITAHTKDF